MLVSNESLVFHFPEANNIGYEKVRPRVLDTLVMLYKECVARGNPHMCTNRKGQNPRIVKLHVKL